MKKTSKPINVGIAGIGRAGWGMHCPELKGRENQFRIMAACDTLPNRRTRMADAYQCRTYNSVEEMVKDPEVELIDIATRSTEHVKHALLALKAGKHVFLEKPMAVSYAEAKKLVPAMQAAKGKLFIRHNRRFEPAFQHVREIIASGLLGDVYEIKLRRNGYGRRDDWQTIMRCGGGQLLNWGPHIIDHALRLLGTPVADMWSDLKKIAAVGDAEDHIKIILKGTNGRIVDLEISGGSALGEPEYLVHGSRGALRSEGAKFHLRYIDPKQKLTLRRANPGDPEESFGSADTLQWVEKDIDICPALNVSMTSIWDYLYESIRNKKKFPINFAEALEVMNVISKARKGTPFN